MTTKVRIWGGALLILVGCGGGGHQKISKGVVDVQASLKKIQTTKGNATGNTYTGSFEFKITDSQFKCTNLKKVGVAASKVGDVEVVNCTQTEGAIVCANAKTGVKGSGYINNDGAFGVVSSDSHTTEDKGTLTITEVGDGKFTSKDGGSVKVSATAVKKSAKSMHTCYASSTMQITRKASGAAAAASSDVWVEYQTDGQIGGHGFTDLRARKDADGMTEVGAKGPNGERLVGKFSDNGTGSVAVEFADGSKLTDQGDCTSEARNEDGVKRIIFKCPVSKMAGSVTLRPTTASR